LRLDEHNETHALNAELKVEPLEDTPIIIPKSEPITTSTSEKTTTTSSTSSKTKVHRCRQCSFVSNVKVFCPTFFVFRSN